MGVWEMIMLNENTIINGQMVNLSKEEQCDVTNFHKSRIAFAVIFNNDDSYNLAINIKDAREHRVYLQQDFGINDEVFESLVRGYIKHEKIVFYISSHFHPVAPEILTDQLIKDLLLIAGDMFGPGEYMIGNGVKVGKPGEEWAPIDTIGTYTIEGQMKTNNKILIK